MYYLYATIKCIDIIIFMRLLYVLSVSYFVCDYSFVIFTVTIVCIDKASMNTITNT